MLNRRQVTGMLAAAPALLTRSVSAQGKLDLVRLGNGSGVLDTNFIFVTCGQNKRLKFYEEEGVAMEITTLSGNAENIRMVAAGHVDVASFTPISFIQLTQRMPDIDLLCAYCWARSPYWYVSVKPDSTYKTLADLKGQKIGIRNQGDTGYDGARMMLKELGFEPEKDFEWVAVGESGPGGDALYRGRVEALAYLDTNVTRSEIAGFALRQLPNSEGMKRLIGATWGVKKSVYPANKSKLTRFFRAMAKSTIFAHTNPEAAIRMLWEDYPESKPKGKSEEEAMKDALAVIKLRRKIWLAQDYQPDKRLGAMRKEEWEATAENLGLKDKVGDVSPFFTQEMTADINAFDAAAIAAKAKEMKI